MERIILSIIFFVSYTASFSQNWQLIWEDNFDGTELDSTKWIQEYGTGAQYNMWGWGNGELQHYQSQNTTLSNGIAKIEVKEEPAGIIETYWNTTSYYSSSKISTKGIFDFRYGKVEARIKTIDGQGFWPAFWMLPTGGSWPCDGEIDIMEQWGNNYLTNSTTGAAHIGTCPYSQSTHFYESFSSYISSGSYADDFHTYSVIWKEDTITWYVDETELFSLNPSNYWSIPSQSTWPFNANEWYLMINLAITQAGPNSNTVFPNQMEIDYVRVYQENITSIESVSENEHVIFPNPSNNYIVFKGNNLKYIRIYNIEGSLILDKIFNKSNTINVEHLESGMYLVELEDSFGVKTNKKIIIN
jgi:beta-glucanase (GH16 family)